MFDEPQSPAPGWYPTPDGGRRYWDGSRWLSLPDPDQAEVGIGHEGSPRFRPPRRAVVIAAAVLLVLAIGGTALKLTHDSRIETERVATEQAEQVAADRAAKVEADRVATEIAEQERVDAGKRVTRALSVGGIETSVQTMAQGHADEGTIDGPIISVSCSPVSGGSTDDLTETTTVFECFAATTDNGDGTMSGYKYNATMNWNTGSYTYGFGAP